MIGLEFLLYAGVALLFIYGFVVITSLMTLLQRTRTRSPRDLLIKVAAALCWPYAVWQVCRDVWK